MIMARLAGTRGFRPFVLPLGVLMLSSCFSVNEETMETMSSFKLCSLLTPKYVTTPGENKAVRRELKKRGVRCGDGHITVRRGRTPSQRPRRPNGRPRKGAGSGSGFIVNAGGDVLTNAHVAGSCGSISTRIAGRNYSGDLIAKDQANDLAVVRFPGLPVRATARFAGRRMRLGTNVVVFGYPLTTVLGEDLKATTGNVSGTSGVKGNSGFFQFTAPIQPGNSGGPVVDSTGSVAGVVSFKLRELWVASKLGTLPQLVNFGIKSRTARSFLQTKGIPHSVSRATRTLPTVEIATAAERYTIRIVCR